MSMDNMNTPGGSNLTPGTKHYTLQTIAFFIRIKPKEKKLTMKINDYKFTPRNIEGCYQYDGRSARARYHRYVHKGQ